jgi:hypothetical protein
MIQALIETREHNTLPGGSCYRCEEMCILTRKGCPQDHEIQNLAAKWSQPNQPKHRVNKPSYNLPRPRAILHNLSVIGYLTEGSGKPKVCLIGKVISINSCISTSMGPFPTQIELQLEFYFPYSLSFMNRVKLLSCGTQFTFRIDLLSMVIETVTNIK